MDEPRTTSEHRSLSMPSLPEVHRTVGIPTGASFWRKVLAFSGPGFLVAVGYMDPGNWATDIAGGDGNLAQYPEEQAGAAGIITAASLRQIELGDDAEARGKRLNQNRHEIGHEENKDELVGKARPACDIRRPVSRVHVPDRH